MTQDLFDKWVAHRLEGSHVDEQESAHFSAGEDASV